MANRRIDLQEKLRLINECRQSGLSDYRWCKDNNINPSTFYNWISRLKDEACSIIPRSQSSYPINTSQDVVRVDIVSDTQTVIKRTTNNKHLMTPSMEASIEISIDDINIRINNNANPILLTQLIGALKGSSC